jgi:hypothetical protein
MNDGCPHFTLFGDDPHCCHPALESFKFVSLFDAQPPKWCPMTGRQVGCAEDDLEVYELGDVNAHS